MSDPVPWAEAAFLGLIQGLTEFLPVSSSAHLRIIGPLLPSGGDPGAAFTAITQIGTELAVLLYFRHDIARIFLAWWASLTQPARRQDPDARMGWLILIGTLPIAVLGLLFAVEGLTVDPANFVEAGVDQGLPADGASVGQFQSEGLGEIHLLHRAP